MFAIARIVELMQQTVNAEDEADALKKNVKQLRDAASRTTSVPPVTDDSKAETPGSTPYTLRKRNVSTASKDE